MSNGVMVALLPINSDWCQIDMPHMTLVYAGTTDDVDAPGLNDLAKDAASLAMLSGPQYLRVTGVKVFGDGTDADPQVNVLTLLPSPELWAMRRALEQWNASEFPFTPHCTVGPLGSTVMNRPDYIAFDRMCVAYGDEYMTFWLKK